jgi:TolA-binding protein/TM2 domain-containing membrane protein YozV
MPQLLTGRIAMQLMRWSRQLLVFCLLLGFTLCWQTPEAAHAAEADADGTPVYAFGLHLFRLGEYYRAVTELKRFTLLFPQHPRHSAAQLLIGLALQEDGLADDAFLHFQRLRQTDHDDVARVATFKLGELRFFQQQYRQAIEQFQQFLQTFPDGPLVPRTTYLLSLSWALQDQPERALHLLHAFPSQHALSDQAQALQRTLQTPPPQMPKSPRTAGILAGLLPGAGHLYVGNPMQAVAAFLLNGLFITGAVFAIREGLEATGAILLYFETGWYLGNIKSAVEGARDANRRQRRAIAERLQSTYAPPLLSLPQLQAPALGLRLKF